MRTDHFHEEVGEILAKVQLPLNNLEFHIDQYLLVHGIRLDTETRILLASVRDGISSVAMSARDLTERTEQIGSKAEHVA